MAMDFYFKDLYPGSGYAQTTETTLPDSTDKAEIVDDKKAAAVADGVANNTNGKKLIIAAFVVICFAVFLGVAK